MSKRIKKFLKVIGVLALLDLTDICGKGHMLSYLDRFEPEAAKRFRDTGNSFSKLLKIRFKMIEKSADIITKSFN